MKADKASIVINLLLFAGPILSQTPPTQPGQIAKTASKASEVPKDLGWPRLYTDGKATIAIHQPQVDDWKDFNVLEARSAIEIQPDKGAKKEIAAVHWKSQTDTSIENRTVVMERPQIVSFRIPGETEEKIQQLRGLTEKLLPAKTDVIALDRVLAYLDPSRVRAREVKVSTEPPPIMVSTKPAILLMTDGPAHHGIDSRNEVEVRCEHELGSDSRR